jgi:hypothetical protein
MKYFLLRDEKSIAEIADKAYKGLSEKERASAETALLKANSNLKSLSKVRKGTIIHVPSISRADSFNKRSVVDPVAQITAFMADHLSKMERAVNDRYNAAEIHLKDTTGKMAELNSVVKGWPVGEENAAQLKKSIDSAQKNIEADKKERLEAVKQLQKAVELLDR